MRTIEDGTAKNLNLQFTNVLNGIAVLVYYFPMAAETNQKLTVLKQYNFIILQFCMPEVSHEPHQLNTKVSVELLHSF